MYRGSVFGVSDNLSNGKESPRHEEEESQEGDESSYVRFGTTQANLPSVDGVIILLDYNHLV